MSERRRGRFRLQFRLGTVLLLFVITGLTITLVKEVLHRRSLESRFESTIPRGHVWLWSLSPKMKWSARSNLVVMGKAYLQPGGKLSNGAVAEVTYFRLNAGEFVTAAGPVKCPLKRDKVGCYSFDCVFKRGTSEFPNMPAGDYLVEAKVLDNGAPVATGVARVITVDI